MTTQSDDSDHWIDGSLEERVLVRTMIAVIAASPVALLLFS